MAESRQWAVARPPMSRIRRMMRSLTRQVKRRIFLPGDTLAQAMKRAIGFILGWGTLIGLLAWGAYQQGILHGIGDGITFCAVFFLLAFLAAPGYMRPGGPRGRTDY
jgi:hypothetical protein